MAEVVFSTLVASDPILDQRVRISSAGTARWHVGKPMDDRAKRALERAGFSSEGTLGAFASSEYLDAQDVVIVMTREHRNDVRQRLSNVHTEIVLLRNLLEENCELDVYDPYYGDDSDFSQCLEMLIRAGQRWTEEFRQRLDEGFYEV